MDPFTTPGQAIDAIVTFDREKFAAMPEHIQAELTRLAGVGISPVDRIVRTAEILFANRDVLTRNADRRMVARLVEYAALNGWHGLQNEDRAVRIAAVMNAEAGDDLTVDEADIPRPHPDFVKPEDQPTPTLPAPAP